MNIKKRLYFVLIAIVVIISAGSIGYYILFGGKPKFMDCIFMTVISLTSVVFRSLKFEPDTEIKQKGAFAKVSICR